MAEVGGYDRVEEVRKFDETKAGVKGLCDSGLTTIPRIFTLPASPNTTSSAASSGAPPAAASIPTIDLSRPIEELVAEVGKAASEWGFFQVVGHGVPLEVMEETMRGVGRFFEGDLEEKKRYYSRDVKRKVRYNSSFDLYTSSVANWRDTLGVILAPDPPEPHEMPEACRESTLSHCKYMDKLGKFLLELLSRALGLDPSYLNKMDCSKDQIILLHYYPPCPQPELAIGTSPHSDSGFLTILVQDQLGGLQVFHNNQWVDVSPLPGAFVVNIGDLLQLISNDRFISVEHRVLANKKGPRISVAFFYIALSSSSSVAVYGPIKELLSEDNPPLYKETLARDYVAHYYTKGLNRKSALADFRI